MSEIYLKYFPNLDEIRLQRLMELKSIYAEWNEKINVISRKDMDHFEINHVLHSLSIAKAFDFKAGSRILDFGTGGGFPGIPLAIFFPEVEFLLVDSIGKKIKVVQAVIDHLQLQNVRAIHERVEKIDEKFDFITCRAVGRIGKILPWVRNALNKENRNEERNGYIFLKGGDLNEELKETHLKIRRHPISDYFEEGFFQTKEIVYLS